jgi:CHAT domain-containing protein/tetratricopeptide (TPR) repeat protein
MNLNDYAACLEAYGEAAEEFGITGDEVECARLTSNQAWVLKNLGRFEEGLATARSALDILERYPPSIFLAAAWNAFGTLAQFLGRYDETLEAFALAEDIYAALGEQVRLARLRVNRAYLLETLDRFREAIALLAEARKVLSEHGLSLEVARTDLNLAIIYSRLGRYDEALGAFDRAEDGFSDLGVPVEIAVVYLYRADLYAEFNLLDELLETAVDWQVFEEREMQWQAARAALHKASAWRQFGPDSAHLAIDQLDQARDVMTQAGDPTWARLAALERADLDAELGDWALALPVASETEQYLRQAGMPIRAASASLLAARCCLAEGDLVQASERYEGVLALSQSQDLPALGYRAHHGVARVAEQSNRLEVAYDHDRQAVEMLESLRSNLRIEEYRIGFLDDKLAIYADAVDVCLRLGRQEEAFAYVERAKSGALVDLLAAELGHRAQRADTEEDPLLARLAKLLEKISWQQSRQSDVGLEESGPSQLRGAVERSKVTVLEREATKLWREVQQASPLFRLATDPAECTPDRVSAVLDPGEVLLQYYQVGSGFLLFVLGPEGLRTCQLLGCSDRQVNASLSGLDKSLQRADAFASDYTSGTPQEQAQQQLNWLYDDLIRPVETALNGAERLIIAPDGPLYDLPFQALNDGQASLLDKVEVSYAPSATTFRLCRENAAQRKSQNRSGALLVGFDGDGRLPYVESEIRAAAKALPRSTVLLSAEATLANLQVLCSRHRILHLATHAEFRKDNALFSALQLAGGDWLRVMHLYQLDLQGALVALSGCETGRHRLLGGDAVGISRGFFAAGASTLVVSLWPVDDAATSLLIERFYGYLAAGQAAGWALREAQLWLRDLERADAAGTVQPYAHPFFWAPFCLSGAPELSLTRNSSTQHG